METGRIWAAGALPLLLSSLALGSCAVGGDGLDDGNDDGGLAWTPGQGDSGSPGSGSWPEGGQSLPRPGQSDAGALLGGLGGLLGGGATDAGSAPVVGDAGENPEGWTLNADSAKECPPLPPPIPIVGGLCVGVYFTCGWTNAKGAKYSCTCDWIHWLCI